MKNYSQYFKTKKIKDDTAYVIKTDDCPVEIENLCFDIHKQFDSLPNNWIYDQIYSAFMDLEDLDDDSRESLIGELEADPYYNQLYLWFGEPFADTCIDEAREVGIIENQNIYDQIAIGQIFAKRQIYNAVKDFLEKNQ